MSPPTATTSQSGTNAAPAGSRVVAPEILDGLPADHADAIASRRDLRRINAAMGNLRWMREQITARSRPGDRIVELGAGDGMLAAMVCARRPELAGNYHALDLAPRPAGFPREASWHCMNLWSGEAAELLRSAQTVAVNLMLHHFQDDDLRRLGLLLEGCREIIVCEPCRRERFVYLARLTFPFINRVTRHDMVVSIRAGFRRGELTGLLGGAEGERKSREQETWLGALRGVYTRAESLHSKC